MVVQICVCNGVISANGVISTVTLVFSCLVSLFAVKANSSFTKRMLNSVNHVSFGQLCKWDIQFIDLRKKYSIQIITM